MQHTLALCLTLGEAADTDKLKIIAADRLSVSPARIKKLHIERKNIDARSRSIKVNLTVCVYVDEIPDRKGSVFNYTPVDDVAESVIIVGAGSAGIFAALRLIELGLRPIIFEQGKEVSERKKDIATLCRNKGLNPTSNYCFGEGGAGTFSDGKLYTRSKKKGNIRYILDTFYQHGAQDEILYQAHPHIGTDRLPEVIKNMRQTIIRCGGKVHFNTKIVDFIIEKNTIKGVVDAAGQSYLAAAVVLATGHSARDIYTLLHQRNIALQSKGFAMGVRVEHPQTLIDKIQYHGNERGEYLPAAAYQLVTQVEGRGVYSFCMCPGGHIVPSATAENEIVVNGMSASARSSAFANSGIVVEIRPEDLFPWQEHGALAGLYFQQYLENLAFNNNGGQGQTAPAQRLADFVKGKLSLSLPDSSYLPGLISSPLHFWLPESIGKRLREGFRHFDRKMRGFLTNEAIVVGVESRTSSPVRLPRNEHGEHIEIRNLYPAGEGSGYAGGITSSAMDGVFCAEQIALKIKG